MNKILKQFIKRFTEWIVIKQSLHENITNQPHITEGEIWWISWGENVGQEINGKGRLFSRPGLVYKKLARNKFLALPTTTRDKQGNWYIPVQYGENTVSVILSEARSVDTRRLTTRLGRLSQHDFKKVREGFKNLYCK